MGKAVKGILIAAITLIAAGMVLCVVSLAAGVDYKELNLGHKYKYKGEVEQIDQTFTDPITSLDLSICSGEFEIKKGTSFKLVGEDVPKGSLNYKVVNGKLTIEDQTTEESRVHFSLFGIQWNGLNFDKKITLYVPENVSFEEVDFLMQAGSSSLESFKTKSGDFSMDAGSMDLKNIEVTDKTTLTMNAGKMSLEEVSINNSKIEVDAGKCTVNGKLYGETVATISAGSMKIETDLEESQYDFKTDASAGSIKINGKSYNNETIDNNAENSFDLDCSAGAIKVNTR